MGKKPSRKRQRRSPHRRAWWRSANVLAVVAWLGTIGTLAPHAISGLIWAGERYQDYRDNRALAALHLEFQRRIRIYDDEDLKTGRVGGGCSSRCMAADYQRLVETWRGWKPSGDGTL